MSNIIKSFRVIERNLVSEENVDLESISLKEELLEEAREKYEKIILDAEEEAKKIIDSAHKQYEKKLKQAEEKANNIFNKSKNEGYYDGFKIGQDEGYKKGYETGYGEGEKESEKLIKEALAIKEDYIKKRNRMSRELEEDLIQLIIAIYEKVLYKNVEEDKELIVSLISNGIDNLEISEKLTIIVSREDYDAAIKSKDIILAKASLIDELDIRVNSNMEKGDCILETSKGSVDVSLKNQLDEVKDLLTSILSDE